jgi:hypothetical protein
MDDWAIGHFRFKNLQALQQHRMRNPVLEDNVGTEYCEHPVSAKSGSVGGIKGIAAFPSGITQRCCSAQARQQQP